MVLGKRVQLYHDLVIDLKAQLEEEAAVDEHEEQELAQLEESLASGAGAGDGGGPGGEGRGGAGLDNVSLASEATSGAQVTWAGGACGGLVYESVGELRVAVESLQVRQKSHSIRADYRVHVLTLSRFCV